MRSGWAVQSFGYHRYLPLGRPEILAENLDRWGVDEIVVQCIDRSKQKLGPDIDVLSKVAKKNLGTPLIYAGGVSSLNEAVSVINSGADRLMVDAILHDDPKVMIEVSGRLGAQALIACLPVAYVEGTLLWYDYRSRESKPISREVRDLLEEKVISELMLVDWNSEGKPNGFNLELIRRSTLRNCSVITFGGLSSSEKMIDVFANSVVKAAAIGNFLSYKEHALEEIKKNLDPNLIRISRAG